MYFTNTPSLNSMEAIMKQPPGYRQRGGGRKRKPYQYTKADCSCRLCPHYQGKRGCAVSVCQVLDIRLECSAAPLEEAVQSTFSEVTHTPFKQRLQRIYKEKRGGEWLPYNVAVIDLRNPTQSDGNNLLHLVNKYMDAYKENPDDIALKARAEKYAKIIAKTLIYGDGDASAYGQNAFFYDAAEGLMTSVILLIAEFAEPKERHIVSVFKLIQELMAPSSVKGKNHFQLLLDRLPPDHKARWFAGAALSAGDQAMASVMSTALSRLNSFLDTEMEQVLCFDTVVDAERFCQEKSAIFVVMPEENPNAYFMISLLIQQLYREILSVADENGGKLPNRVMFYCDEFGTMPPIQSAEMMYSASRSRRLSIVSIIQSYQQLEKNYGREGAAIIQDNCQITIAGGFAPTSETADIVSKTLGSRTVLTGSVSRSKNDPSQSLQMTERPLMSSDELKNMKKGSFKVYRLLLLKLLNPLPSMSPLLKSAAVWALDRFASSNMAVTASRKPLFCSAVSFSLCFIAVRIVSTIFTIRVR